MLNFHLFEINSELQKCFKKNPLIPNTVCFPLSLSVRPRSRSRDSGDENDNIQERHFRPHFLQAPGDLIVQEGRLCRMDCKVNTRLVRVQPVPAWVNSVMKRGGKKVSVFKRVIYWFGWRDFWQCFTDEVFTEFKISNMHQVTTFYFF